MFRIPRVLLLALLLPRVTAALPADADSAFALHKHRDKERGTVWRPLATFFVPGLDQWREAQYDAAASYSALGIAGVGMALGAAGNHPDRLSNSLDTKDDRSRFFLLGGQMYQAAGSYSAYHAFRTAVRTQSKNYDFLVKEERPSDLLIAPVRFDYLARPTTLLPLAVGGLLFALQGTSSDYHSVPVTGTDAYFAGSYSYLAGTNEEALFRGWMMPLWRRATGNDWAANGITALIFGAAHISSDNWVPWPQFLMGAYLGWVSQYRDYTISESIFIHTWWDVMAFLGDYAFRDKVSARLQLPPIAVSF